MSQTERKIFESNRLVAVEYLDENDDVQVRYDLVAGKCYNYSASGVYGSDPEITDMTPEAIEHFFTLDTLLDRIARIEAVLWPAPPPPDDDDPDVPDAPEWDEIPSGVVPPGGLVKDIDGKVYRNVSRGFLSSPPSGFPGMPIQWKHLWEPVEVEPDEVEPDEPPTDPPPGYPVWQPWDHIRPLYQSGDRVRHNGRNWEATVGNNHWEPGVFGWKDLGPVD